MIIIMPNNSTDDGGITFDLDVDFYIIFISFVIFGCVLFCIIIFAAIRQTLKLIRGNYEQIYDD
jgi:hypothetical protein